MPNYVMNRVHLTGKQSRIDELMEIVRRDDGELGTMDFNKLIPMPECMKITAGSIETDSINAYLSALNPMNFNFSWQEKMPARVMGSVVAKLAECSQVLHLQTNLRREEAEKMIERFKYDEPDMDLDKFVKIGEQYIDNVMKYGVTSWYDWACRFWGSKWNEVNSDLVGENELNFETAWSRVMPIISKLAELFPDLDIAYRWADEDIGSNVGSARFSGGKLVEENLPEPCSKEAYELAAEVWDSTVEEFGFRFNVDIGNYEYPDDEEYIPDVSEG